MRLYVCTIAPIEKTTSSIHTEEGLFRGWFFGLIPRKISSRAKHFSHCLTNTVTVRYVQEQFTDDEFERLKRGKGDRTWRQALLEDVGEREVDE